MHEVAGPVEVSHIHLPELHFLISLVVDVASGLAQNKTIVFLPSVTPSRARRTSAYVWNNSSRTLVSASVLGLNFINFARLFSKLRKFFLVFRAV
jgi:hypothetical protein